MELVKSKYMGNMEIFNFFKTVKEMEEVQKRSKKNAGII